MPLDPTTAFPTALDTFPTPLAATFEDANGIEHDLLHQKEIAAIMALQASQGISGSAVTTSTDYRLSAVTAGAKALSSAALDTDTALTANSDTKIATQKATKAYADTKVAGALDTDATLAANSDVKVASQKATKTYADTKIPKSTIAAKGDILTGTAASTPTVLTAGSDYQGLRARAAATSGLEWANAFALYGPEGFMINGKIVTSVASSNLTVAIKTLAGADPSASDPVFVRVGDTMRTITAALSMTLNAGTNHFGSGSAVLATLDVDYFVYIGYKSSASTVFLAIARVSYGRLYSDMSATATNERYLATSVATPAAGDIISLIGRFNAILSATASFNWSLTTSVIVNTPILKTRTLTFATAATGFSALTANVGEYYLDYNSCWFHYNINGTSNATTAVVANVPMARSSVIASNMYMESNGFDNGADTLVLTSMGAGSGTTNNYKTTAVGTTAGLWTNSGNKAVFSSFSYSIV